MSQSLVLPPFLTDKGACGFEVLEGFPIKFKDNDPSSHVLHTLIIFYQHQTAINEL